MSFILNVVVTLEETFSIRDFPILGTILCATSIVLAIAFLIYIVGVLLFAIDSSFLPKKRGIGRIVNKTFKAAYAETGTTYNAVTGMSTPYSDYHSEEWTVGVEVGGRQGSISIAQELYDSLSINNEVVAEYANGRLTGNLYLENISHA